MTSDGGKTHSKQRLESHLSNENDGKCFSYKFMKLIDGILINHKV